MRRLTFIAAAMLLAGGVPTALAHGGGGGAGAGPGGAGAAMGGGHGGGPSGHASSSASTPATAASLDRDHGMSERRTAWREGPRSTNGPDSPNRPKGPRAPANVMRNTRCLAGDSGAKFSCGLCLADGSIAKAAALAERRRVDIPRRVVS
jgi:hypothetical protein